MNLKTIQLGRTHLNACIDLDKISLKGLWTKSQWEKELANPKRICIGVIELESKNLLGFCCAWIVIDELQITSLAVHPIHQRKGIGGILFSDIMKRSKSLRINNIVLEVKDTNKPAQAFYKSKGFKLISNRPSFYRDGSNALIFNKEVNRKL